MFVEWKLYIIYKNNPEKLFLYGQTFQFCVFSDLCRWHVEVSHEPDTPVDFLFTHQL